MDNNRLTGDIFDYTKKAIVFYGGPAAQGHMITAQAAMRGHISCYQMQINVLGAKA